MNEGELKSELERLTTAMNVSVAGQIIHQISTEGMTKGDAFFEFLKQAKEDRIMSTPAVKEICDVSNPIKQTLEKIPKTRVMRHLW